MHEPTLGYCTKRGGTVSSANARVVIIGAGFGGLEAAKALKRAAADVTIIDRQNHHCFQPLLYQVATAALSPADIAWPIRHILKRNVFIRNTATWTMTIW
jgi:NADH dehydrogenase